MDITVEKFNSLYPVGTKVKYYPNKGCKCTFLSKKTITPAYVVCGRHSVRLNITTLGKTVSLGAVEVVKLECHDL